MSKKALLILIGLAAIPIGVWWVILQGLPVRDGLLNYYFNVAFSVFVTLSGFLSWYFSVKSDFGTKKKIFRYFGLSLLSWGVAGFIWSAANIIYKIDVPYPSVADVFYLLCTFFLGLAFWNLHDLFQTSPKRSHIYVSLFVVLTVYILIFFVLMKPQYAEDVDLVTQTFNYLYPLTDALILSFAAVILLTFKKIKFGLGAIVSSLVFQAAADIVFGWRDGNGLYWNGDIADLLYFVSGVLLVWGLVRLFYEYKNEDNE